MSWKDFEGLPQEQAREILTELGDKWGKLRRLVQEARDNAQKLEESIQEYEELGLEERRIALMERESLLRSKNRGRFFGWF